MFIKTPYSRHPIIRLISLITITAFIFTNIPLDKSYAYLSANELANHKSTLNRPIASSNIDPEIKAKSKKNFGVIYQSQVDGVYDTAGVAARGAANKQGFIDSIDHEDLIIWLQEHFWKRPEKTAEVLNEEFRLAGDTDNYGAKIYLVENLPVWAHYAIEEGIVYVRASRDAQGRLVLSAKAKERMKHEVYELIRITKYGFRIFGKGDAQTLSRIPIKATTKPEKLKELVSWYKRAIDSRRINPGVRNSILRQLTTWLDNERNAKKVKDLLKKIHKEAPDLTGPTEDEYLLDLPVSYSVRARIMLKEYLGYMRMADSAVYTPDADRWIETFKRVAEVDFNKGRLAAEDNELMDLIYLVYTRYRMEAANVSGGRDLNNIIVEMLTKDINEQYQKHKTARPGRGAADSGPSSDISGLQKDIENIIGHITEALGYDPDGMEYFQELKKILVKAKKLLASDTAAAHKSLKKAIEAFNTYFGPESDYDDWRMSAYIDSDTGFISVGLDNIRAKMEKVLPEPAKVPEEIAQAEKLLEQTINGIAYIRNEFTEDRDEYGRGRVSRGRGAIRTGGGREAEEESKKDKDVLPENLKSAENSIKNAIEVIATDPKGSLEHINKALDAFREYSKEEPPEGLSRHNRLLDFNDGEIPEALRQAKDLLDKLFPKEAVALPEERVATGRIEWVNVDALPGSGVVEADKEHHRIVGPKSGATKKFNLNLSNVYVDQAQYWPNEVVTLKIIRPELRNQQVEIVVEGGGGHQKVGPIFLNEHGIANVVALDGSKGLIRTGNYEVKVINFTTRKEIGHTKFDVIEGSLGEAAWAKRPEAIFIGRDENNPRGNRWASDPTKPNGVVLKEFWITVNGKPYTGKVTVEVECEYCGHGANALACEKTLTLEAVEGRLSPPKDIPDSNINLQRITRSGRPDSSILGAWIDPKTGQRAYELNTSYHTGAFIVKATIAGYRGTVNYRIPSSHYEERQTVRITEGLGRKYEVSTAPWAGMAQVPGRNIFIAAVKDEQSPEDPVHIKDRANAQGQNIPGLIADEDGYIRLEIKKNITGVRIFAALPQPDGSFKDKELAGIGSSYKVGDIITIPIEPIYSYIKIAGFEKKNGNLFVGHTPAFAPATTKVTIETPKTASPGSRQTITVKTTDVKGTPKSVGVLVLISDTRIESTDPSEKMTSESGKSIRNSAGALYQQRDTTGTGRFISRLLPGGKSPAPSGGYMPGVRTLGGSGRVRCRGAISRPQSSVPTPPSVKKREPMDVVKIEEEEAEEPLFLDATDAGVFVDVPVRRIVASIAGITDENGILTIPDVELGGQLGARYQIQVVAVDADRLDFTTMKESHISATQGLSVDVNIPELIMDSADLNAIATVRVAKAGIYTLEIHGAGVDGVFIKANIGKGIHRIPFNLKGGKEGELVLELKDASGDVKKQARKNIRIPSKTSVPLFRLETAGSKAKTVFLEEGETAAVYPGIGRLLRGIVSDIITMTKGWYPHVGAQSAKAAIKARLINAIEHGIIDDEGQKNNLVRMIDSDVADLYNRFYDPRNGLFTMHPGLPPDMGWSARVCRELVHARKALEDCPIAKGELDEAIELIDKMIKGVEIAISGAGEDMEKLAGYNPSTGEDLITIKDEKGVEIKTVLTDPRFAEIVKKAMEDEGIAPSLPLDARAAEEELKKLYERIGDLEKQIEAAKAAFLADDNETFIKLFESLSRCMMLSHETGMSGSASLIGGIHSSSAVGLSFIELLVMLAEAEKKKFEALGTMAAANVEFRGATHPLTETIYLPIGSENAVREGERLKIPPFSVAQLKRSYDVTFDSHRSGSDNIARVTNEHPITIRQNEKTEITIELKSGNPQEYYIDVLLPTTVTLDRVIPSYMDPYGKMLYGLKSSGGEQIQAFTIPFGASRTMTLVLDGAIVGKSKGMALVRHMDNPSLAKTLDLPQVTVVESRITGHADLGALIQDRLMPLKGLRDLLLAGIIFMKEYSHVFAAKILGLKIEKIKIGHTSGEVTVRSDKGWKLILFIAADPLSNLLALGITVALPFLGAQYIDGIWQAAGFILFSIVDFIVGCYLFKSATTGSRLDWQYLWNMIFGMNKQLEPVKALQPELVKANADLLSPQERQAADLMSGYSKAKLDLIKATLNGDKEGYALGRKNLIEALNGLRPHIKDERIIDRAVKEVNSAVPDKPALNSDEIITAIGQPLPDDINRDVLALAREMIDWLPEDKADPSRKEFLAQKLRSITYPLCAESLIPQEPISFGEEGALGLVGIFDIFSTAAQKKMMAVTQLWGDDLRVGVLPAEKQGRAMFEALALHEYMHALGHLGVLPITPRNEVLTHAVTALRLAHKEGPEGVEKTLEKLNNAFLLGQRLYNEDKLPDSKENPQAFIKAMFNETTKAMGFGSAQRLERLTGSAVAGWLWELHKAQKDNETRAQLSYKDLISLIYKAQPSVVIDQLTPADQRRLNERQEAVENVLRTFTGQPQLRVMPELTSRWAYDPKKQLAIAPVEALLHPDQKVTFGSAFDFIAQQFYINHNQIEKPFSDNPLFMLLFDILALPNSREDLVSDGNLTAVPAWIKAHVDTEFSDPIEVGQVILSKEPAPLQFLEALYYQANFGNLDPRITNPEVIAALQKAEKSVNAAIGEKNPEAFYKRVKDDIWPIFSELIKKYSEEESQKSAQGDKDIEQAISNQLKDVLKDMLDKASASGLGSMVESSGKETKEKPSGKPEESKPSQGRPAGTPQSLDEKKLSQGQPIGQPKSEVGRPEDKEVKPSQPQAGEQKPGSRVQGTDDKPQSTEDRGDEQGKQPTEKPTAPAQSGDQKPGEKKIGQGQSDEGQGKQSTVNGPRQKEGGQAQSTDDARLPARQGIRLPAGQAGNTDDEKGQGPKAQGEEKQSTVNSPWSIDKKQIPPIDIGDVDINLPLAIQKSAEDARLADTGLTPQQESWYDTQIYKPMQSQIGVLKRDMDTAFPPSKRRGWEGGKPEGEDVDDHRIEGILMGDINIMRSHTGRFTKPDVYIDLLVDETGSMTGDRTLHAQRAVALMLEAIMGRNQIHAGVSGYSHQNVRDVTNDNGFPIHLGIKSGTQVTKKDIVEAVSAISAYTKGGNQNYRDPEALKAAIERSKDLPKDSSRHIFVITDGDPSKQFDRDKYRQIVKDAIKEGINVWMLWMDQQGQLLAKELVPEERSIGGPSEKLGSAIGEGLRRITRMSGRMMMGSFFSGLYKRLPIFTSLFLAPVTENAFISSAAYLILNQAITLWISGPLAIISIILTSAILTYKYHRTVFVKGTLESRLATAQEKFMIMINFVGMGSLLVLAAAFPCLGVLTMPAAFAIGVIWHILKNLYGDILLTANTEVPVVNEGQVSGPIFIENDANGRPNTLVILGERYPISDGKDRVPPDKFYVSPYNLQKALEFIRLLKDGKKPIMMHGDAGTGKDFLARSIFNLLGRNVRLMPFYEDMNESDLFFRRGYSKETESLVDVYSEFLQAAKDGDAIILSEYNKAPGEVRLALNRALETALRDRRIMLPTGEIINVHPNFIVVGTLNEGPGYQIEPTDPSESDRWAWLEVDYLPRLEEAYRLRSFISTAQFAKMGRFSARPELLQEIYSVLDALVDSAQILRAEFRHSNGQLVPRPLSTRVLERIAQHLNAYPEDVYLMGTLINRNFNIDFASGHVRNHIKTIFATKTNLVDRMDKITMPSFTIEDLHYEGSGDDRFLVLGNASVRVKKDAPVTVREVVDHFGIDLSAEDLQRLWWIMKDLALGVHIAFIGYKGTGKSMTAEFLGELMDGPAEYVSISFSEQREPYHYVVRRTLKEGKIIWEELALPQAMRGNKLTILEEFNTARPRSTAIFNEVFARNELNIPELPAIRPRKAGGFGLLVLMNPPTKGYRWRHETSNEVLDRMTVETFGYPQMADELAKLKSILPDASRKEILEELVSFASVMRSQLIDGSVGDAPSMRFTTTWAKHLKDYPQDRDSIFELIDEVFHVDKTTQGDIVQRAKAARQVGLHKHFLPFDEEKAIIKKAVYNLSDETIDKFIEFFDKIRKRYVRIPFEQEEIPVHPSHRLLRQLLMALEFQEQISGVDIYADKGKLYKFANNFFANLYLRAGMREFWLNKDEKNNIEADFNAVFRPDMIVTQPVVVPFEEEKKETAVPARRPCRPGRIPPARPPVAPEPEPKAGEPDFAEMFREFTGLLHPRKEHTSDDLRKAEEILGRLEKVTGLDQYENANVRNARLRLETEKRRMVSVLDEIALGRLRPNGLELPSGVTSFVIHPRNSDIVIIAFENGALEGWDIVTKTRLFSKNIREEATALAALKMPGVTIPSAPINALAISHNGNLVAAGIDEKTIILDITNLADIKLYCDQIIIMRRPAQVLSFSPDDTLLAIGSGQSPEGGRPGVGVVNVFDIKEKKLVKPFRLAHTDIVTALAWKPDGSGLLTAGMDGSVILWNKSDRKDGIRLSYAITTNPITTIAWHPTEEKFAFGMGFEAHICSCSSGMTPEKRISCSGPVTSLSFSNDGKILAAATKRNTINLIDVDSVNLISPPLSGDEDRFTSVGLSEDGRTLLAGSLNNALRIWDLSPAMPKKGGPSPVTHSAMILGDEDKTVELPFQITERLQQLKELTDPQDIIIVSHLIFGMIPQGHLNPDQELAVVKEVMNSLKEHGLISEELLKRCDVEAIIKAHDYQPYEDGLLWTALAEVLEVIKVRSGDAAPYVLDIKPAHEVLTERELSVPQIGFYGSFAPMVVTEDSVLGPFLDTVLTFDQANRQADEEKSFNPMWILDKSWLALSPEGIHAKRALVEHNGEYIIVDFAEPIKLSYLANYNESFADRVEATGIPTPAHPRIFDYTEDKAVAYSILEDHGIPIPRTMAFIRKDKTSPRFERHYKKPWMRVIDITAKPDTAENPWPQWKKDLYKGVKAFNEGGDFVVKRNRGMQADTVEIVNASSGSHNDAAIRAVAVLSDSGKTGLEREDSVIVQQRIIPAGLDTKEYHIRAWVSRDEKGQEPKFSDLVVAISDKGTPTNLGKEALSWEKFISSYPVFGTLEADKIYKDIARLSENVMGAFDDELEKDAEVRGSINSRIDFMGIDIMIREKSDGTKELIVIEANDFHAGWMQSLEEVDPSHKGIHSRDWVNTMAARANGYASVVTRGVFSARTSHRAKTVTVQLVCEQIGQQDQPREAPTSATGELAEVGLLQINTQGQM